MFKGRCLSILLFCFIQTIHVFDVIKRKKKQSIIFMSFLSIYIFIVKVQFETIVDHKLTFVEILRKLPSNQRRFYVWNKAFESLNNQSFSSEFGIESLKCNQTVHQLIENTIQKYKVRFTYIVFFRV